ncbi:hypothetical protein EVA_22287 [gut metagenome]|uniref:Uncharacterized protein n=1 Tax=gut metagenome TaxID=749906 RepID=J9FJ11_9ZZZZ
MNQQSKFMSFFFETTKVPSQKQKRKKLLGSSRHFNNLLPKP